VARKGEYVGFRVEKDIAERFDKLAESKGLKRADLLRAFMYGITSDYTGLTVKTLIETKKLNEFEPVYEALRVYNDEIRSLYEKGHNFIATLMEFKGYKVRE
jgi:hypothetical protein